MILATALAVLSSAASDLASPPLAMVASGDSMEIFTTGSDSALWTRSLRPNPDPGKWSPWVSLGGKAATPPSVVASKDGLGGTRLHLFYFDADSNLQVRIRNNASWSEAARVEGLRSGLAPSAGWRKGVLDVFATSPDGLVRRVSWDGTAWQVPAATLPDSTHVSPTALGFDAVNFYENLYILDRNGSFREQSWNGSAWKGPVTVPGTDLLDPSTPTRKFASAAATAYQAQSNFHFLCAVDSVFVLHCNFGTSEWSGWYLDNLPLVSSAPTMATSSDNTPHGLALIANRRVLRFRMLEGMLNWFKVDTTDLPDPAKDQWQTARAVPFALHATPDTGLKVFRSSPIDSTLQVRTYHRGEWSAWSPLQGKSPTSPTVSPNGEVLAWRRSDSTIAFRRFSTGIWGTESTVPALKTAVSPSITRRGDVLDLVAMTPEGLVITSLSGNAWSKPEHLGFSSPVSPFALGFEASHQYENVYAIDSNGLLSERWWDGATWSSWVKLSMFPQPAISAPGSVYLGSGKHITCVGLQGNILSCLTWNGSSWGDRTTFQDVATGSALTLASDGTAHLLALDAKGKLVHYRYANGWERLPGEGSVGPVSIHTHSRALHSTKSILVQGNRLSLPEALAPTRLRVVSTSGETRILPWAPIQNLPAGNWSHLLIGEGDQARSVKLIRFP